MALSGFTAPKSVDIGDLAKAGHLEVPGHFAFLTGFGHAPHTAVVAANVVQPNPGLAVPSQH